MPRLPAPFDGRPGRRGQKNQSDDRRRKDDRRRAARRSRNRPRGEKQESADAQQHVRVHGRLMRPRRAREGNPAAERDGGRQHDGGAHQEKRRRAAARPNRANSKQTADDCESKANEEVQTDVGVIEQRRRRQYLEVPAVGQQSDDGHNGKLRHTIGWSGSHAMGRSSMVLDAAIA